MEFRESYKLLVAFTIIFSLLFLKTENYIFIYIQLFLLILSVISNRTFYKIFHLWRLLTQKIGLYISLITLSITFFLFITPLAYLYRIFNQKWVKYFYQNTQESYFENVDQSTSRDLKLQW